MAVLISEDKKELIITCKCGCDDAVHLKIEDGYAYQCFMSGNFYNEQYGACGMLRKKLKKIWAIVRNRDYCYSEIVMDAEDFAQFKKYINKF